MDDRLKRTYEVAGSDANVQITDVRNGLYCVTSEAGWCDSLTPEELEARVESGEWRPLC